MQVAEGSIRLGILKVSERAKDTRSPCAVAEGSIRLGILKVNVSCSSLGTSRVAEGSIRLGILKVQLVAVGC